MAHVLRLRRALSLSTVLLSRARPIAAVTTLPRTPATATRRDFHSSRPLCLSSASRSFGDMEKIDPDAILFEGCDYKHWLIVMDFGKDPASRPPPDQMVQTYVETAAKVIGSVEEAKRKIYACSTTTYTGFQVEVDEDTSKKFEDLPGVIFVLPDSYLDPVNKEYGGDKYINGEIIPRPPPVQYGRTRGFRPNDQRPRDSNQQGNQSYNQQRNPGFQQGNQSYNQQRNPGFQQGNPGYNQQGSMPQGGRGYPPQGPQQGFSQPQNFSPQQNYAPSGQVGRDEYRSGQRNFVPPHEGNHNNGFNRVQGQMSNQPGNQGGYAPSAGNHAYEHPQGLRSNNPGSHSGYAPPGQMGGLGDNRSNFSTPAGGAYGQTGPGSFDPSGAGQYRQSPNSDSFGRGAGYTPHGENQRFPPGSNQQSNPSEHGNYSPGAQTGFNQEEANFQNRKSNF